MQGSDCFAWGGAMRVVWEGPPVREGANLGIGVGVHGMGFWQRRQEMDRVLPGVPPSKPRPIMYLYF